MKTADTLDAAGAALVEEGATLIAAHPDLAGP
ncbi:hypothetical protein GGD89_003746 [Roseospira visakhapatnamensis]|uniref:Uncharacterized protein n=1 Tax=Roseospira visakhapatnamensis TaxID=390880 RepID=A0A7W6RGE2_9PROT|nr:hypothetical protein [Roseospira visakhapatnamensis]